MQLMCDAISVLGSRHGLMFNPVDGCCQILRFDPFTAAPKVQFRAGAIIDGKEYVFPLCADGERFTFFDQRITTCSTRFIGIHAESGIKVSLNFVTPFRPRDAAFSTTPVIGIRMNAEIITGNFRWTPKTIETDTAELFIEIIGGDVTVSEQGNDAVDVAFISKTLKQNPCFAEGTDNELPIEQLDRVVCTQGTRSGQRFSQTIRLDAKGEAPLELAWCSHNEPILEIHETKYPFKYADQFVDLNAVAAWARTNTPVLFDNAAKVDGIIAQNNQSKSLNDLMAQTLHAWLANTWWINRDGRDWFSVWEGCCYFHSTVDVEYTQAPFYLAVWPELLRSELEFWPEYSKDGTATLGERGADTLFLSHDCGSMNLANGQHYPHEMEVEETSNYLILLYTYWRRSGDFSIVKEKEEIVRKYLAFLVACDTTGNCIPDKGVANTVDDASPAIQYGREQVYLAVKTLAAFLTGALILREYGDTALADSYEEKAATIRNHIEQDGWLDDHYATLLDKSAEGVINPWTGEALSIDEIPGWDSHHIYTENGMALLDMVGLDLGLDPERVATDLRVATEACLREYGCVHTDFVMADFLEEGPKEGLAGAALNPGWISMNMLRDIAAAYRAVDLRALADRYWQWQVTTNTQIPTLFFETFCGNNLNFYPRGIAIWGMFDALGGLVIDKVESIDEALPAFPQVRVPRLLDAKWHDGTCTVIES